MNPTILEAVAAPDPSDDDLWLRAVAGERDAFGRLVQRHEAAVRRFLTAMVGDPAEARELAQDAFVALWRHRERYAEVPVRPLLYTVAKNRARSVLRRRAVLGFLGLREEVAPPAPEAVPKSAPEQLVERQTAALVQAALARLPPKFREPLVLRFVEGLSYEELSAILGLNVVTARSRVHYGLRALAKKLPKEIRHG